MKINKKINIFLIILSLFLVIPNVEAKTLRDLKNELTALKQKKSKNEQEKKLTEQERKTIDNNIKATSDKITESENNITKLTSEINDLNDKISEKELEIKEIIHFLQISNGENAYLEYIFGSKDITDFIYRSAVSGQLVSYNDKLMDEYNETIKKNKNKQEELKIEISNLEVKQKELEVQFEKLGTEIKNISEISMSIDEEIAAQEKAVNYYENQLKCGLDENINTCGKIPFAGKFIRPVTNGRITSQYGSRCYWNSLQGRNVCTYHYGIDISGGDTKIYAAAPGTIVSIQWYQSCGGTKIFVHHNINGTYYTTGYYHLKTVNVKVGDYVDQNTVIATMGGDSSTWSYDKCTTGQHLHFAVATGLYLRDYSYWSQWEAHNLNPVSVVNFPAYGVWFSNRVAKY